MPLGGYNNRPTITKDLTTPQIMSLHSILHIGPSLYIYIHRLCIHTCSLLTTCQNANCRKCEQNFIESIRISIQHYC